MKNTTEKFHYKYNIYCNCVVTVICTPTLYFTIYLKKLKRYV